MGDIMRRERPGGFLTGIPAGKSTSREAPMYNTTPIRIPDDLLDGFPDAMRLMVDGILSVAGEKFQTRWYIQEAIAYLLLELTPVFKEAVRAGTVTVADAHRIMGGVLDRIVDINPAKGWAEAERIKREARQSEAWWKFTGYLEHAENNRGEDGQHGSGDA
jgi:hypothetical protein